MTCTYVCLLSSLIDKERSPPLHAIGHSDRSRNALPRSRRAHLHMERSEYVVERNALMAVRGWLEGTFILLSAVRLRHQRLTNIADSLCCLGFQIPKGRLLSFHGSNLLLCYLSMEVEYLLHVMVNMSEFYEFQNRCVSTNVTRRIRV